MRSLARSLWAVTTSGALWFILWTVAVIAVAAYWTWALWPQLMDEPLSEVLRNVVLITSAPVALGLAMWRSWSASLDARTSQRNQTDDRFWESR